MSRTFKYFRPNTINEACEFKSKYGNKAKFLAGCSDLMVQWQDKLLEFEYGIDLSYIDDLRNIKVENNDITIGSMSTVHAISKIQLIRDKFTALFQAALSLGTPQVRNIATVGGNLCNAAPSADLAVALLSLDANAEIVSKTGRRTIPLYNFYRGVKQTVLGDNEMLLNVILPVPPQPKASTFKKVTRNSSIDIAMVNAAVNIILNDMGDCTDVYIALGASAPVPMRATKAEQQLIGINIKHITNQLVDEVSNIASAETKPISDLRASADYRKELCRVLTKRALDEVITKLKTV